MPRLLVGVSLLLAAGVVHVGLTLPARRARDEAREAFARAREEREGLRAELARLERRAALEAVVVSGDAAAAARALRRALLASTRGLDLGDVRIAAQPGRGGSGLARGRLGGTGGQAAVLRVADRLADPGSGARLERLDLSLRPEGVRLEAEAAAAGPGS